MTAFGCASVLVLVVTLFASHQGVSANASDSFVMLVEGLQAADAGTCTYSKLRSGGCYAGVALKSERTGRWCAQDSAGGQGFICNRGHIGPWEKFTVVPAGAGCSGNSCDVSFASGRTGAGCVHEGDDRFNCEPAQLKKDRKAPTVFRMEFVQNGNIVEPTVFLKKNSDGNKICADDAGLRCNRNKVGPWERFKICFKPFWCL